MVVGYPMECSPGVVELPTETYFTQEQIVRTGFLQQFVFVGRRTQLEAMSLKNNTKKIQLTVVVVCLIRHWDGQIHSVKPTRYSV